MTTSIKFILFSCLCLALTTSCVSKKKYLALQESKERELELANEQLGKCGEDLNAYMQRLSECQREKALLESDRAVQEERIRGLKEQVTSYRYQLDNQVKQLEDLTRLSQSANANISATLSQLEQKDEYIQLLQSAKSRADSINLALAVNLKTVLRDGIADEDVEVKVDKTVVFINLSDKMLFQSGRFSITERAREVLGKIAQIIQSRPNLEVMVEGYTDNVPIKTECIEDNWDLSVKRATSVVRVLQDTYNIDPNRLVAAGRGEYNTLASNETAQGRSINRRTRIIILPKLDQFYDLLDPNNVPK